MKLVFPVRMKTVNNNRRGFSERELLAHENPKIFPTHRPLKNNQNQKTFNSWDYHNRFQGSFRSANQMNFKYSRDKSVKYNQSKTTHLMNAQDRTLHLQKAEPWSEEALELERKQQLSDTANKLLNKLKMWNTEKSGGKEPKKVGSDKESNNLLTLETANYTENMKNKQIHQIQIRKVEIAKEKAMKMIQKTSRENIRCFHLKNKSQGIFENKQKKIHQNIIGELMTMPKENLNKVLMNPKIHPKIERKMAQIVKENRLILAQKFRHLAESKINSPSQFQFESKFINDVENLIDPDLAIDLCQLPPELIKQMGDIFQLDFDGCLKGAEAQEENSCKTENNNNHTTDFIDSYENNSVYIPEWGEANDYERSGVKLENHEDAINCTEIKEQKVGKISVRNFANCCNKSLVNIDHTSVLECNGKSESDLAAEKFNAIKGNFNIKKKKALEYCEKQFVNSPFSGSISKKSWTQSPTFLNSVKNCIVLPESDNHSPETNAEQVVKQEELTTWYPSDDSCVTQNSTEIEERISDILRTSKCFEKKSCEAQTIINLLQMDHSSLFQQNISKNEEEAERATTVEEIKKIDELVHELNQRRFFLFLKLLNLNTCATDTGLKKKLMQSITNYDRTVERRVRNIKKYNPIWSNEPQPTKKMRKFKSMRRAVVKRKKETDHDVIIVDGFSSSKSNINSNLHGKSL